jgi:hypothetical protein
VVKLRCALTAGHVGVVGNSYAAKIGDKVSRIARAITLDTNVDRDLAIVWIQSAKPLEPNPVTAAPIHREPAFRAAQAQQCQAL